jgi:hypothetical protein
MSIQNEGQASPQHDGALASADNGSDFVLIAEGKPRPVSRWRASGCSSAVFMSDSCKR